MPAAHEHKTFRDLYCERFGIAPESYEEAVFRQCLFPHGRWPAKILWRLNRSFFDDDLDLVRTVADCTGIEDVRNEVSDHFYHHRVAGLVRRIARIRVSGQKLLNLASVLFHHRSER